MISIVNILLSKYSKFFRFLIEDGLQAGGVAVDDVLGRAEAPGRLMFVNFIFIFVLYCYRLSVCSECTAVPS